MPTPLTLEALEGILGRRNDGEKLFSKLDAMEAALQAVNREIMAMSARLTQAEETNKRLEKSNADYAATIEKLRQEVGDLKISSAVDRAKLGTIVAGATLMISGLVSWWVNYVMKGPGGK
jgi:septal ring factor EnvC (AmiA/AmiB activator)